MREYVTNAFVLEKEPAGEHDQRVTLYTEELGKVRATVVSGRKITAKLSAHLEPLRFVKVRLVEKNVMRVTDALSAATPSVPLRVSRLLDALLPEREPDVKLWHMLIAGAPGREFLAALGFDPAHAACARCERNAVAQFVFRDMQYYCRECAARAGNPAGFLI